MREIGQDLRSALRNHLRQGPKSLLAVLTLALGIGANLAIFSAVSSLLRELPLPAADRLVVLATGGSFSKAELARLRLAAQGFDGIAGYSGWRFTLTGSGEPAVLDGARVTGDLFPLLGARAAAGRLLVPADGRPGAPAAAVISYGLWQRLGGAPAVVGSSLRLDGAPVTVVGVMGPELQFPRAHSDLWLPTVEDPAATDDYGANYLTLVARLRPGLATSAAQADLRRALVPLAREFGGGPSAASTARLEPLRDWLLGATRRRLLVLQLAVAFVFLIACANVTNLHLARLATRRRELSLRHALGAQRRRLVRQLVSESLVLAALAAIAATAVGALGARLVRASLPAELPGVAAVGMSTPVLVAAAALAMVAGLLCGLLPAWWAVSPRRLGRPHEESDRTSAGRSQRRLLGSLVVVETTCGVILVVAATLMLQSFWRLSHEPTGFRLPGALAVEASLPALAGEPDATAPLWRQVREAIGTLPGVSAVGGIHLLPFGGNNWNPGLEVAGETRPENERPEVYWRVATAGYFAAAGIPLRRGRAFTEGDDAHAPPVAVVNETLARQSFPGRNPLGQRVRTPFEGDGWAEIVGVVGDTRDMALGERPRPQMYRPLPQWPTSDLTLLVRGAGDPTALAAAVRQRIWTVRPDIAIVTGRPFGEVVASSVREPRLLSGLLATFGALALVLGLIGTYGALSFAVEQRQREFAIRGAVGASAGDLLRLVLGNAATVAGIGVALGLLGAWAGARVLQAQLHETAATDPATFAGVAAGFLVAALLAAWLPAHRAAHAELR